MTGRTESVAKVVARREQALVVVAAAWLAAAWKAETWLAFTVAYLLAWALLELGHKRVRSLAVFLARRGSALPLAIVLLLSGLVATRGAGVLLENEDLPRLTATLRDRALLEAAPSIAPSVVFLDRPQTLYVSAKGARSVTVSFGAKAGAGVRALTATKLVDGLFRVRVGTSDMHVTEAARRSARIDVSIDVDGTPSTRELVLVTPLAHPRWVRMSRDGLLAATVSEETDELELVREDGSRRRVEVADGPRDVAFLGTSHALLVVHASGVALRIDGDTGQIAQQFQDVGEALHVMANATGTRCDVSTTAGVTRIDFASSQVRALSTPIAVEWLALGADGDTVIASSRSDGALHALAPDGAGNAMRDAGPKLVVGRPVVAMSQPTAGGDLYVTTTDYVANGARHLGNHFIEDQILRVDARTLRVVSRRLTARRTPRQSRAGSTDRGVSPMQLAIAPDGRWVVAFAGSDEVWWWSPDATDEPVRLELDDDPLSAPHGVGVFASGRVIVTSPSEGAIGLLSVGRIDQVLRMAKDDEALTPFERLRREGERVFYETTRAGISCQSCHLHAGSDAAMHNLGDRRLAPTLSVRGLAGTAPYLRDGSYERLESLVEIAERIYRGFPRPRARRPEALAAYLTSLPRDEPRDHDALRDLDRVREGAAAFVRARCADCHAFPAMTNLAVHRAGVLFPDGIAGFSADEPLDTPSLLGTARAAPYLADGRAKTLADVLERHNASNRHGDTASLSAAERAALIAFLEAL